MQELLKKIKTLNLALLDDRQRSSALIQMARNLITHKEQILKANKEDLQHARTNNLAPSIIARLELDSTKISKMANSLETIAALKDPLNRILDGWEMPSGIRIQKLSVPLGVIGVIYESRPNVTSDVAGLCIKSGNACILKGGKEANASNKAILHVLQGALLATNIPIEAISMINTHEEVNIFLQQDKYIDLIIPRGGEELIQYVKKHSNIPIIKHDKGICHIYVHYDADVKSAINIILNAKLTYPAACNAVETILLNRALDAEKSMNIIKALRESNCKIMGDDEVARLAPIDGKSDFTKEYGAPIVNVKFVDSMNEAIEHINIFGSEHSDAIITMDLWSAETFCAGVRSACVYVNASTRFSDGGEFGLGAEVGISTSKLHVRGPMGLDSLTTYKYKISGLIESGAIRK